MFEILKTKAHYSDASGLLLSRDRWTVGDYIDELIRLIGTNAKPWKVLLDFLPFIKKGISSNLCKRTLPSTSSHIFDIEIILSDDPPVEICYWRNAKQRIEEILGDLYKKMNSEGLNEEEREFLGKKIERLKHQAANHPTRVCAAGLYVHHSRRIILYRRMLNHPLSVLAHELFHAYHANHTETMRLRWGFIAHEYSTLVESLATMNEYLFLDDGANLFASSSFCKERKLQKDLEMEALAYDPDYWPYSGFLAIKNKLRKGALYYIGNRFEPSYARSLLNDKQSEYHNAEIIIDYYLTTK